jgi:hypothetical protein
VKAHLPDFSLRVYCDASVDPARLRAAGDAGSASTWSDTFIALEAAPHVNLVWYECQPFLLEGKAGHVELFGTFPRFLPFFGAGLEEHLPAWAGAPSSPDAVVFCTDVDYGDYITEHAMMHAVSWYARLRDGDTGVPVPQLLALAASGSVAARHEPPCGLPPFYSGLIATRARAPVELLDAFLRDAAQLRHAGSAASALCARYVAALHDPTRQNFTYTKRRVAEQKVVPFGTDEFFLTSALKPTAIAGAAPQDWLFMTIPSVDTEMRFLLTLVRDHVQADPAPGAPPSAPLLAVLAPLAAAAGASAQLESARSRWVGAAAVASSSAHPVGEAVESWLAEWPKQAARQLGLWNPFPGHFTVLDSAVARPIGAGLREALAAAAKACALGALRHSAEDLTQIVQQLEHFAVAAPGLVAAHHYTVGGGLVRRVRDSKLAAALISAVSSGHDCGVPRPPPGHAKSDVAFVSPLAAVASGVSAHLSTAGTGVSTVGSAVDSAPASTGGVGAAEHLMPTAAAAVPGPISLSARVAAAGWSLHTSRSTGKQYWHHAASGRSLWVDAGLPEGWAWGKDGDMAPMYFVELATGKQTETRPTAAANGASAGSVVVEPPGSAIGMAPASKRPRLGDGPS